jgi:thiol-disulfide isomerase/thioredoxin
MKRIDEARPVPDGTSAGGQSSRLSGIIVLALCASLAFAAYQIASVLRECGTSGESASAPIQFSADPLSVLLPVPDLKLADETKRSVSLSDFKGRLVLLSVWATWCPPCRDEMPSLDRLQAKFDPSKFLVLPLSIDRDGLPAVARFYRHLGLKSLGVYIDQSGTTLSQLGLTGIPATVLINSDGVEIGRKTGPAEWDSASMIALIRNHLEEGSDTATGGHAP